MQAAAEVNNIGMIRREKVGCVARTEMKSNILLAIVIAITSLGLLTLPGAYAQQVTVYSNTSKVLSILGTSWAGAGYDDQGDAHYLFTPEEDMTAEQCSPKTGRPSKCAIDRLHLDLLNPPKQAPSAGTQYLNFTMRIHGDIFENSPSAHGFFEMPFVCRYERNHSVLAMFNASSGDVEFQIVSTRADMLGCFNKVKSGVVQPTAINRCSSGRCFSALNGEKFKGKFRVGPGRDTDPQGTQHHLEIVLWFPYKHFGTDSWSEFSKRKDPNFQPTLSIPALVSSTTWATKRAAQIFRYSLYAAPHEFRGPVLDKTNGPEWFRDRRPKILSVDPPFGPEAGGPVVTIKGVEFPEPEPGSRHNASITLEHGKLKVDGVLREWGGQVRECCETRRLSDTEITCRLPRIACLHRNPSGQCSHPGALYANQTVSLAVKPQVKGYYAGAELIPMQYQNSEPFQSAFPDGIDDFVPYEGEWVLEDNDVYGGTFVKLPDRQAGETHLLQDDVETSKRACCPVCEKLEPETTLNTCKIIIKRLSAGVYDVALPNFLYPGGMQCKYADGNTCECAAGIKSCEVTVGTQVKQCECVDKGGAGICDAATNFLNASLKTGIERSRDQTGFTPARALSVTSCIDQTGSCKDIPRVSIRETCKQLVWSTGRIDSFLPAGQTIQVHNWKTDGKCDRRMRCVGGPCMWTYLASESVDRSWVAPKPKSEQAQDPAQTGTPAKPVEPPPLFQRREASPQIGLEVHYRNAAFSAPGFLKELAKLIPGKDTDGTNTDARRLQILYQSAQPSLPLATLSDRTFAVRQQDFRKSESALCIPDELLDSCVAFALIILITSDGPVGDTFQISLDALTKRASEPKGDPELRMLNLMRVCVDQSSIPAMAAENSPPQCIKVQYPGFLQFETTEIRTREEVWAYAKIGVTRTGGSDLDVTVDYNTIDLGANATGIDKEMYAQGLGVDFSSKQGQLRWLEGDANIKYIIIPIRWDQVTELSETFQVKIDNAVNAKLMTEPEPQYATVTIVGINDMPPPRYVASMQSIIGAVCGAATAVPFALLSARFIRSLRRGHGDKDETFRAIDDDDDDDSYD